ncbi:MAG: coenzyme A pyrophosphatase [Candidatus Cloacimonadota bacterium]|nr:MAG: coenzyme A pyrophosphatase [Candidatus Cloacimonadota bacterium]PIE78237.1 MAG: coenzyme A pyrophosphatase [Candidatus Delongbacteria bacterium]
MDIEDLINKLPNNDLFIDMEEYYKSAVLIPLIDIDGEINILFEKRAENIRQGGEVCFPGGGIDIGENSKETVIRELFEELGIESKDITLIREFEKIINPMARVYVETWFGKITISGYQNIKINSSEVSKIFLVPLKYFIENKPEVYKVATMSTPFADENREEPTFPAKQLGLPERYHKPWARKTHNVYLWKNEEIIWGLTAKILKKFVDYLGEISV